MTLEFEEMEGGMALRVLAAEPDPVSGGFILECLASMMGQVAGIAKERGLRRKKIREELVEMIDHALDDTQILPGTEGYGN